MDKILGRVEVEPSRNTNTCKGKPSKNVCVKKKSFCRSTGITFDPPSIRLINF